MQKIKYSLRDYKYKDQEFVYQTKKDVYKKYVEANWGEWNEEAQREMFKNFITAYGDDIKIIVVGSDRIGFYHGNDDDKGNYELGNICIIPEYQGKGIGTKVLKEILAEHNHQDIYLRFFKQNPVVKLYERLGFEMDEELEFHYKMCLKSKK